MDKLMKTFAYIVVNALKDINYGVLIQRNLNEKLKEKKDNI